MKKIMTRAFAPIMAVITAIGFSACGNEHFKIEGTISEAADSMLYLENMALDGPQKIDSVKLSEEGAFSFSHPAPANAPEFYRLRIGQQTINFSVDTVETISVKASYPSMAFGYTIDGGDNNNRIKELATMQMQLQEKVRQIVNAPDLSVRSVEDSVLNTVKTYKQRVMADYIYKDPKVASSYFALFQGIVVGNAYMMVFDPRRDIDDVKPINAVATSWDVYYPQSLRTENLHNIAMEATKTRRILQAENEPMHIDASKVTEAEIIDIVLPDNKGVTQKLTQLKGKVVLLDFHVFSAEGSAARILALRELYNKYHDRGLEIFQVSLDEDEHFWKTQTAALPWVSVRDTRGASNAYLYMANSLPVDYIINRANQVVLGPAQIKNLETDIAAYL